MHKKQKDETKHHQTNSVEHWVRQTFEMSNHSCEILAILLLTNKEFFSFST